MIDIGRKKNHNVIVILRILHMIFNKITRNYNYNSDYNHSFNDNNNDHLFSPSLVAKGTRSMQKQN